jgi:hypothetical protein
MENTAMSDVIYTEPKYTERADTAVVTRGSADDPWGGWERWLDGHLAIERHAIVETIVETLNEVEANRDHQIRELELKLAELTGALGVLRRGGAMRVCGTYSEGTRYEQHDVVAVDGSSFIAREDNSGPCPGAGWQLLASAGRRGARGFPGPKGERGEPGENATAEAGFHGASSGSENLYDIAVHDGRADSRIVVAGIVRAIRQ